MKIQSDRSFVGNGCAILIDFNCWPSLSRSQPHCRYCFLKRCTLKVSVSQHCSQQSLISVCTHTQIHRHTHTHHAPPFMAHVGEYLSSDTFWPSKVGVCGRVVNFLEETFLTFWNGQGVLIPSWLIGKGQRSTEQICKGSYIQSDNESFRSIWVMGICRTLGPCPALPKPRQA